MAKDTKLNNLVINYLTQEQYDAIESPNENELYLTPDKTDTTTYVSTEKLNSFTKTGTGIEFGNDNLSKVSCKYTVDGCDFSIKWNNSTIVNFSKNNGFSLGTVFGDFGDSTLSYQLGHDFNGSMFRGNTNSTDFFTGIFCRCVSCESPGTYAGITVREDEIAYSAGDFTIIPWNEERPAIVYYTDSSNVTPENRYEFFLQKKSGTFALTSDIKETHHHTITIKEGTKIIFAANRELESATAATTLETLISIFAGTTTAGFGDYILLAVDTAAKLKKQDGTETDLSTLTVTISDTVK